MNYKDKCSTCKKVKYAGKQHSMFCDRYKERMVYCSTVNCYGDCKHYEAKNETVKHV